MTVQSLKEILSRRPFQPVKITLSSGASYEIRHPAMALLTRTDLLIDTNLSADNIPAEFKILSLLHIASVEPVTHQAV